MEFIKPNVEIWEQVFKEDALIPALWAHVARCTRVCYQSENKKNPLEGDEAFVKRVILRHEPWSSEANHLSMLEHGTVYLKVGHVTALERMMYPNYLYNKYSIVHHSEEDNCFYITTNLRVIIENNWLDDLQFICSPTDNHAKRVTVSFTTNIGVTREFNRHRADSPSEESTRYCNYSKKHNGQIKIGLPAWLLDSESLKYIDCFGGDSVRDYIERLMDFINEDEVLDNWCDIDFYLFSLTVSQWCYNMLIKKGWTAQQAREVLPLATKSQLIHTAFVDDWKHFFNLRAVGVSGAPHPNAKLVAKPLLEEFIKRKYI